MSAMIFSLSVAYASNYGPILAKVSPGSSFGNTQPRVSNTPTLDGNNYLAHYGTCIGDVPVTITTELTKAQVEELEDMMDNFTDFTLSVGTKFYVGMISSVSGIGGKKTITFQPTSVTEAT